MRGMATTSHTMTVAEAAHELGVSERTVWRYLRSGRLHGETTGPVGQQRTLIDPSGIESVRSGRGGEEAAHLARHGVAVRPIRNGPPCCPAPSLSKTDSYTSAPR